MLMLAGLLVSLVRASGPNAPFIHLFVLSGTLNLSSVSQLGRLFQVGWTVWHFYLAVALDVGKLGEF